MNGKPTSYWRILHACGDLDTETGLSRREFEAHVEAVTAVVERAKKLGLLVKRTGEEAA